MTGEHLAAIVDCFGQSCGAPCTTKNRDRGIYSPRIENGVCNRNGSCVSPETNPCEIHGCDKKRCGETCLMGDIMGWCNSKGDCEFTRDNIKCGKLIDLVILF